MNNFYTKDWLHDWVDKGIADVGDFSYGFPKIMHWGEDSRLKIGKFCSIADEVVIFLGGNHRSDWITTYPFTSLTEYWPEARGIKGHPETKGDVEIGNDVWIGYGVTIMSGVKIGDGAVIGARSVVTKDVGEYEIVVSNPARIVRKRFSDEQIKKLLELKWWNWPISKIRKKINVICSRDIKILINN